MSILSDVFYNYLFGMKKIKEIKKNDTDKFYYLSLIKETEGWSIHGLWPQYNKNQYPSFCREVNFDINKLEPILKDLNEKWYSEDNKNENFWKHEWEKHGSCMFIELNELEYFEKTLELFDTALQIDLPSDFYNEETKKCLIPLTLDFKFDI
jgi:ribonuclease I|tara:strand:- start:4560 stop:5015 length:456 start_codon:yes stop_codon:yes gene_type:complete